MKSSGLVLSIVVLLLLPTGAWNQTAKGPHAATTNNDEAEIRALLDRWAKAFEGHDIDGIMSNYAPGDAVVAYDIAPPLQYKGKEAYRKDYLEFLAQYDGPIHVEYRDMRILSSGDVGFVHALERFTGKLKNGQQSDIWLRYTGGLRKMNGHWLIVHDHVSVPTDFESGKAMLDPLRLRRNASSLPGRDGLFFAVVGADRVPIVPETALSRSLAARGESSSRLGSGAAYVRWVLHVTIVFASIRVHRDRCC